METAIELAFKLVLAPLAHQGAKALYADAPWLEKLFQMNKIERLSDATSQDVAHLLRRAERDNLVRRNAVIQSWVSAAQVSESEHVRNNVRLIREVAATVAALIEAGVSKVVMTTADNDLAIVSHAAFERNAAEILPALVRVGTSASPIVEIEAFGPVGAVEEVIAPDVARDRYAFVISLVDTLFGVWSGPVHDSLSSDERMQQLYSMSLSASWMTTSEAQNIESRLASMSLEQLDVNDVASELDGRSSNVSFLNVFVVGMRGAGKSTSRWLLTGCGRHGVSETAKGTTRDVTALADSTGRRLMLWDTPGLNEGEEVDIIYKAKIKAEMMGVSHISAVILQVNSVGRQTAQEKTMLKEYNAWFGGALSSNLIIAFRAKTRNKFRAQYIKDWDELLVEIGVGAIGEKNYIFFSANTAEDDDEDILAYNQNEIRRASDLIEEKQLCVVEANETAARAMLESEAVQEGERRDKLLRLLKAQNLEETRAFEGVIENATRVSTSYLPGQLQVSVTKFQRNWDWNVLQESAYITARILSLSIYKRAVTTKFAIQATCPRTTDFLFEMSEMPSVRRGKSESWINSFFRKDAHMWLMSMTKVSVMENRVLHLFADGKPVDETSIKKLTDLLGQRKALSILESVHEKGERFASIAGLVGTMGNVDEDIDL